MRLLQIYCKIDEEGLKSVSICPEVRGGSSAALVTGDFGCVSLWSCGSAQASLLPLLMSNTSRLEKSLFVRERRR